MKELLTFFVMAAVTTKDESKVILNRPHTGGCEQRILLDTDIAQEGGAKAPAVLHIWTFISGLSTAPAYTSNIAPRTPIGRPLQFR